MLTDEEKVSGLVVHILTCSREYVMAHPMTSLDSAEAQVTALAALLALRTEEERELLLSMLSSRVETFIAARKARKEHGPETT